MQKFEFFVTGFLTARVEAESEEAAFDKLQDHLTDHSPVRDWEIHDWLDTPDDGESPDIQL